MSCIGTLLSVIIMINIGHARMTQTQADITAVSSRLLFKDLCKIHVALIKDGRFDTNWARFKPIGTNLRFFR